MAANIAQLADTEEEEKPRVRVSPSGTRYVRASEMVRTRRFKRQVEELRELVSRGLLVRKR